MINKYSTILDLYSTILDNGPFIMVDEEAGEVPKQGLKYLNEVVQQVNTELSKLNRGNTKLYLDLVVDQESYSPENYESYDDTVFNVDICLNQDLTGLTRTEYIAICEYDSSAIYSGYIREGETYINKYVQDDVLKVDPNFIITEDTLLGDLVDILSAAMNNLGREQKMIDFNIEELVEDKLGIPYQVLSSNVITAYMLYDPYTRTIITDSGEASDDYVRILKDIIYKEDNLKVDNKALKEVLEELDTIIDMNSLSRLYNLTSGRLNGWWKE